MKKILFAFLFSVLTAGAGMFAAVGDTMTVTGTITDRERNEPVIGATVVAVDVDGVSINKSSGPLGTTSDMDGKFTLADVPSDAKIKISYVGYKEQTLDAGQDVDIELESDDVQLQDVSVNANIKDGDSCARVDDNIKKGEYKKVGSEFVCIPTECANPDYEVQDNKCVKKELTEPSDETKVNSDKEDIGANVATTGDNTNTDDNTKTDDDAKAVEDNSAKIEELKDKVKEKREQENSKANKLIDALGTGVTGAGGMMLGMGLAEQAADADAESEMKAYIETFRCKYGSGGSVKYGTTVDTQSADLFALRQEYASVAETLRSKKEALGISPGIEAETVLDNSGLYKNEGGTGINHVVDGSLYRALTDATSDDAAAWNDQKKSAKNLVIAGAVTAGVGAVGSAIASGIVNRDKDKAAQKKAERQAKRAARKGKKAKDLTETDVAEVAEDTKITENAYSAYRKCIDDKTGSNLGKITQQILDDCQKAVVEEDNNE